MATTEVKEKKHGKKKGRIITWSLFAVIVLAVGFVVIRRAVDNANPTAHINTGTDAAAAPVVYMTTEITPESLMVMYEALGREATGKVAIKVSTGEPGGHNYLQPSLIQPLVQHVGGTIVESNTAYGGQRASTALHMQVAEDHGFTGIAAVDILDTDGEAALPVQDGNHLSENLVGANYLNYDFTIVLSHFKGHAMAGYGGAIKNISIGIASPNGKGRIHSGGVADSFGVGMVNSMIGGQTVFLEAMTESASSVMDHAGDNILYINVMNRLSVDCDCESNPSEPDMHDIGILASLDPVALDKACIDLVYAAPDGASLVERIESRNGLRTLEYAHEKGIGSWEYRLENID